MGSTLLNVVLFIIAIGIGGGIAYLAGQNLNFDLNTQIIVGIVMTLSVFTSLYFMTKGSGG